MSFFDPFEGKSGVYFISPFFNPSTPNRVEVLVKIGMSQHKTDEMTLRNSGGLASRLDSYLLCYPGGFWVYAVLQTQRQFAYKVEKFFQTYFTNKGRKTQYKHSKTEEWYNLSLNDVKTAVAAYMRTEPNYVVQNGMHLWEEPQFVDSNGRVSNRPVQAMATPQKRAFQEMMDQSKIPQTMKRNPKRQMAKPDRPPPFHLPDDF